MRKILVAVLASLLSITAGAQWPNWVQQSATGGGGSSTWNANYGPKDGTAFLRYLAYLTSGYVDAGTPVFWAISNTNGTSTTSGSWSGIGAQITSGFLR